MFSKQVLAGVLSVLLTSSTVSAVPWHSSYEYASLIKRAAFGGITAFHGQPQPPADFSTSTGPKPKTPYEYQCFGQEGKPYPKETQFISFDSMWEANEPDIIKVNGGSKSIASSIRSAILSVSKRTNMFPQYTLAIVMQESVGKVNAPCSTRTNGVPDECGLMQASPGGSNAGGNSSITQEIEDGLLGTTTGGTNGKGRCGYVQIFAGNTQCLSSGGDTSIMTTKPPSVWPFWAGARIYNSGAANPNDLQQCPSQYGTPSYVMDLANRVLGWTGQHSELKGDQTCGVQAGAA